MQKYFESLRRAEKIHPPESVKVLAFDIRVAAIEDRETEAAGAFDGFSSSIALNSELGIQAAQQTLLHEILHSIGWQLGLNLDESQIEGIATGFLSVLKENKKTMRTFFELGS